MPADVLIFLACQVPGVAWLTWAATYAIVQTTRNAVTAEIDAKIATAVDAALTRGVAEGVARVQLVVETALQGSTWTANLPAGSVVESIVIGGQHLATSPIPAETFAPGGRPMTWWERHVGNNQPYRELTSFPLRSEARMVVQLRTPEGHVRVVPLERAP